MNADRIKNVQKLTLDIIHEIIDIAFLHIIRDAVYDNKMRIKIFPN